MLDGHRLVFYVFERRLANHVVNDENDVGLSVVHGRHGTKPLLPGGVPDLVFHREAADFDHLPHERRAGG